MKPTEFKEQNFVLGPAKGDEGKVGSLPVCLGTDENRRPLFVSKWVLEDHDIQELRQNGGCIYIAVYGAEHPPVNISPYNLSNQVAIRPNQN